MLKPSFRLFIIPLGAVCYPGLAVRPEVAPAPSAIPVDVVREQVVDCSTKSAARSA